MSLTAQQTTSHVMRDPVELQNHLDALVIELDDLSKTQDDAANEEGRALRVWEVLMDEQMEILEMDEDRKGAFPSEKRIESICRRQHRDEWLQLKRAELRLAKATRRASNVAKEIGGLQSNLKTLGTEASVSGSAR